MSWYERETITVVVYTKSGPVEYKTKINAEGVKLIKMEELEIVPKGERYDVCMKGSTPIIVQQTRRSLVKGGTPSSKSTFATMATP